MIDNRRQDTTTLVERLELLEERVGITLSGIYSVVTQENGRFYTNINFDIMASNGESLTDSVFIKATAYNTSGQVLDTSAAFFMPEVFLGFDSGSILLETDQIPSKLRLFPALS